MLVVLESRGSCALDDARTIAKFVSKPVAHNRPSCRDWCIVGGSVWSVRAGGSFVSGLPPARLFPQSVQAIVVGNDHGHRDFIPLKKLVRSDDR
jgi:hypothetical protein